MMPPLVSEEDRRQSCHMNLLGPLEESIFIGGKTGERRGCHNSEVFGGSSSSFSSNPFSPTGTWGQIWQLLFLLYRGWDWKEPPHSPHQLMETGLCLPACHGAPPPMKRWKVCQLRDAFLASKNPPALNWNGLEHWNKPNQCQVLKIGPVLWMKVGRTQSLLHNLAEQGWTICWNEGYICWEQGYASTTHFHMWENSAEWTNTHRCIRERHRYTNVVHTFTVTTFFSRLSLSHTHTTLFTYHFQIWE